MSTLPTPGSIPYNPLGKVPTPQPVYSPLAIWEDKNGVRRFSNAKLQSAIDDALSAVEGSHFAVVGHHLYDQHGDQIDNVTTVSAFVKTSDGKFTLAVAGYKDWAKSDQGVEAKVIWKPF